MSQELVSVELPILCVQHSKRGTWGIGRGNGGHDDRDGIQLIRYKLACIQQLASTCKIYGKAWMSHSGVEGSRGQTALSLIQINNYLVANK